MSGETDLERFEENPVPDGAAEQPSRPSGRAFILEALETVVLAVALFLIINAVSARIRVEGSSMVPTLHDGELVIVSKLHYVLGEPRREDVIVFHLPQDPEQEYIKRVIGLPGDHIEISNGEVRVNGELLDEPYLDYAPVYSGSWDVPPDSLFVLGDNRNNSSDSHEWGPVPLDYVVGKALLVYWPPDAWRLITARR
jgi:signal peptidase I